MGLISAALSSVSGVLAEQYKEYFYCETIPSDVLVTKGRKRTSSKSSNKGSDNIISDGSVIAVADGQCMIIVEQGKVVDICAEPGEFVYDMSTEPSIFSGKLSETIPAVFAAIGKRITYGGEPPKDQRVYYFNTKEIIGNKYGTPSPVPFRVVDNNVGLDVDIAIRCFGEYSYKITNPILFYTNVCGNVSSSYSRTEIDSQLKSELLTALQPAFAKISDMGIRYSSLPGHTAEIAKALNDVLSEKWSELRGVEIISFGVSSVKASEEDEQMIKDMQKAAAFKNPNMAAAHMVSAQADAMKAAANNTAGAAVGFMGMGMAQAAGGVDANALFAAAQQQTTAKPVSDSWKCPSCGVMASGKFCGECGTKKPAADGWTCPTCGAQNKGKFCGECGTKKPAGAVQYKCDKCGWEPEAGSAPPKFCPECGDPFDNNDIV